MHEDQVNEELEKFKQASKGEGRLKIPITFPAADLILECGEIDFGELKFIEENKEKATEVDFKKPNKNKGLPDL